MRMKECDYTFIFSIVGDKGAGKSCLLSRFTDDIYSDSYINTNEDYKTRPIDNSGKSIRLVVYDICGKYQYGYWDAKAQPHGVIITYDSTSLSSFENVKLWIERVERYALESIPIIIVGTKCDNISEKAVDSSVAREFADSVGFPFFETSAKESINIEEPFVTLTSEILNRINHPNERPNKFKVEPKDQEFKKVSIGDFLQEVEQLKREIQKDCEGKVTFSLDRKRIGYLALDALAKNIRSGAQNFKGNPEQFIKEEIDKIRKDAQYLGVEGGWVNSVKDLFSKYAGPKNEESSCTLM